MGNLQEKVDLNQREVATYQSEVGILTAERDQLAHQVHTTVNKAGVEKGHSRQGAAVVQEASHQP